MKNLIFWVVILMHDKVQFQSTTAHHFLEVGTRYIRNTPNVVLLVK